MVLTHRCVVLVQVLLVGVVLAGCQSPSTTAGKPAGGAVLAAVPAQPDAATRYAIYLHGMELDRSVDEPRKARFQSVVDALASQGLTVIAEIRGSGVIQKSPEDLDRYARKVADQARALVAAGVPASHVNVVGYSRGAVIAQMSAGYVGRPDVGYVVLAGCVSDQGAVKQFVPVLMRYAEKLNGSFLSIIEASDPDFTSCTPYFQKATARPAAREIVLQTGKGHLLFLEPEQSWLRPVADWIRRR